MLYTSPYVLEQQCLTKKFFEKTRPFPQSSTLVCCCCVSAAAAVKRLPNHPHRRRSRSPCRPLVRCPISPGILAPIKAPFEFGIAWVPTSATSKRKPQRNSR